MNNHFTIIIPFLCFLLSLALTGLLVRFLKKRSLLDRPNERSNHKSPTPRGGGIALIASSLAGMLFFYFNSYLNPNWIFVGCILLLAVVSWLDDVKDISPLWRFATHISCVALVIYNIDINFTAGWLPTWAEKLIIGAVWVWFINLYNFMDGIDTITGAETIIICTGVITIFVIFALPYEMLIYPAIILAATLGFLVWNCHPARIFLGDVGSVPLGFIIGCLLIKLAVYGFWPAAIILPLYYLADSTYTILKRLLQGKKIWQAHSEHFYQQAVRSGKKHNTVVKIISLFNLCLFIIAVQISQHTNYIAIGLFLSIIITCTLLYILKPRRD